jgi:hypothetical protein
LAVAVAVPVVTQFQTTTAVAVAVAVASIVRHQFHCRAQLQSLQVLEAPAEVQVRLVPEIMVLEEVHRISERSLRAAVAVAAVKLQDQSA